MLYINSSTGSKHIDQYPIIWRECVILSTSLLYSVVVFLQDRMRAVLLAIHVFHGTFNFLFADIADFPYVYLIFVAWNLELQGSNCSI